jgi:hypothetical protein
LFAEKPADSLPDGTIIKPSRAHAEPATLAPGDVLQN